MLGVTERYLHDQQSMIIVGLLALSLLAADVILPTPSSLVSIAAALYLGLVWGTVVIFVGMTICCFLGYYLGNSGTALAQQHLEQSKSASHTQTRWMKRFGLWSLLLSRPIPVLAETSVIMAGLANVPLKRFLIYTLPANAVISISYGLIATISL